MLLFRYILVALLLPVWALAGLAMVAATSTVDGPTLEDRILELGLAVDLEVAQSVLVGTLLGGLAVHLLTAVVTSRAVAAMAGSIGGLIGTALAGIAAVSLAVTPTSGRVETLQNLARPSAIAAIGVISVLLGFRAYLAHMGRWRYAKHHQHWNDHHNNWDNNWGGGDWGGDD